MRTALAGVVLLTGLVAAPPAAADTVQLPTPEAARLTSTELLKQLPSFRPDRLLVSDVPGPVVNDELLLVALAPDGGVRTVTAEQRLTLTGEGDYAIRERGPARSATSLTSEYPPLTRFGAVVWQGFSPGRRDLGARLVLDPAIEATRLPLRAAVSFTGTDGKVRPLGEGGAVPGAGTVTVTLSNTTSQPQELPTGNDADPAVLAPLLDRALAVARRPSARRLPSTDEGLPAAVEVAGAARVASSQAVPLRLTGTLRVTGTTARVEGPATRPLPDGASFAGTLGGSLPGNGDASVTFTAAVDGPGQLVLDLRAVAALNQAELAPPDGFSSWARWAAAGPSPQQRKEALDLLVAVAATGARASSYSPYLGADLAGSGTTAYRFSFEAPERAAVVAPELTPRWGNIGLAGAGALLLLGGAGAVWRRS